MARQADAVSAGLPRARVVEAKLGHILHFCGVFAEAEQLLTRAHEVLQRLFGSDHYLTIENAHSLAQVSAETG